MTYKLSDEENAMALIGTVLVVMQMALLATGFDIKIALTCGLLAAIAWAAHSVKQQDWWLLVTNAAVGTFAAYGLI